MQDIVSYQSEDTQTDVPDDEWKHTMPAFDLDSWIAQYCPELGSPQPWKGGRKWIFPVCPFNEAHTNKSAVLIQEPSGAVAFKCHHNGCSGNDWRALRELRHTNKSAVLIQEPSGAVAFKCHHNGCSGNDWRALRELREPGCCERREEANSDVDLSGILKPNRIEKQEKEAPLFPNPGPVPDKLLSIPGFIDDVVKLSMQSAPYPNRVLSFTGALALLAFSEQHLSHRAGRQRNRQRSSAQGEFQYRFPRGSRRGDRRCLRFRRRTGGCPVHAPVHVVSGG